MLSVMCVWLKTKQKRELVGKTERSSTDKLRERRLKKRRQKSQRLQKEKRDKLKAEKTARLGSMKSLMDAASSNKQEAKSKKKSGRSVSPREIGRFFVTLLFFTVTISCTVIACIEIKIRDVPYIWFHLVGYLAVFYYPVLFPDSARYHNWVIYCQCDKWKCDCHKITLAANHL